LEENLAWISDAETFAALCTLTGNVHDQKAQDVLNAKEQDNMVSSVSGARLMIVGLKIDPFNVDIYDIIGGTSPYDVVEKKTKEILSSLPVRGEYTGFGAIGAQDQKKTLLAVSALTPISLIVVLIILRLVEPRVLRLISIAFPMLVSLVACLGLTGFLLGSITFTEGFFGLMIFGLGVDFGLHLLVRMREEQSKCADFGIALTNTITGCGPAIIAGAITTAGAFGVISFSPDPTARHLGTSGCLGLLLCLSLMLTLLPAIWVIMEKNKPQPVISEFQVPGLSTLVFHASTHPKSWVLGTIFMTLLALLGTPRYHFETDLQKIFNRDVPAVQVAERVQELFQANTAPWVISSATMSEAREIHQKFSEHILFERIFGISDLFPVDLKKRHVDLKNRLPVLRKNTQILEMLSMGPAHLSIPAQKGNKLARILIESAEKGPPKMEDIPISLQRQLMGNDGSFLTFVYGKESSYDGEVIKEQRLAAEHIEPSAAGMGNFIEAAMEPNRPWVPPIFLSVLGFVFLVLLVDLRSPKWIFLAVAPVCVGVLITFGILCWMNVGFSILLFVVVPLLLGLGVDDGLHVVHRMLEDPEMSAYEATISVSRAITMTTLTTCASFCVLLSSNHPGMESMAWTLLIGLPICFFASATLLPALSVLLKLRDSPRI
jgi:predicted RND superfamily exporter protein